MGAFGFSQGKWGHCPRCMSSLDDNAWCDYCGWAAELLLDERLEEIRAMPNLDLPGVKDLPGARRDMAQAGAGAAAALIELGALDASGFVDWVRAFLDAAEIPYKPWEASVSLSLDDEESTDGDMT